MKTVPMVSDNSDIPNQYQNSECQKKKKKKKKKTGTVKLYFLVH